MDEMKTLINTGCRNVLFAPIELPRFTTQGPLWIGVEYPALAAAIIRPFWPSLTPADTGTKNGASQKA